MKISLFTQSWIYNLLWQSLIPSKKVNLSPVHVFFCLADHFEPMWKGASIEEGLERVKRWSQRYPEIASKFSDSDGYCPKHTFFFPEEEYHPEFFKILKKICSDGFGEVAIHLHHRHDNSSQLKKKLETFRDLLFDGGFLSKDKEGKAGYAFIHGNWALDNSLPDGDWCGVNDELRILKDTGCFADFTLPSAPSPAQTRKINSIYYALDDPDKPKSHNTGVDVESGRMPSGDLMLIQGPLALNWKNRKWSILPRIENASLSANNLPSSQRIDLWVKQGISVQGRPDCVFVKVHTHGCQEKNMDILLGEPIEYLHRYLSERYNDGKNYKLHYVTAREMYNVIKALEAGETGAPGNYRDYNVGKPTYNI